MHTSNLFIQNGKRNDCGYLFQTNSVVSCPDRVWPVARLRTPSHAAYVRPTVPDRAAQVPGTELNWAGGSIQELYMRLGRLGYSCDNTEPCLAYQYIMYAAARSVT